MRIPLSLQQLEAFERVAREGSFRAAAQALHVSQPALSRTVRLAEELIGTRLFDRDTRHVALTAAGRELQPIAQRILADFDSAFSELGQFLEGRSGRVRIAMLPSAGTALVPTAMADFALSYPGVGFELLELPAEPLLAAVDDGRADIGITVPPSAGQRLSFEPLFDDPFMLVCRADDPLATLAHATWRAFSDRPFIASSHQSSIRPIVDAVLLRRKIRVRPTPNYPSVASGGAMVAAGVGITALPRLAMSLIATPGICAVPLQSPHVARRIGIVMRQGRSLSPAARSFMQVLRSRAAQMTPPSPLAT